MEEGSRTSNSEVVGINCSACAKNGKGNYAEKYCVECQEYFCKACIQMHGNFSMLSMHSLLVISDTEGDHRATGDSTCAPLLATPSTSLLQLPTERCTKHPAKVIDMYCKTHAIVGCSVCFYPHYKSCDDFHYIPDIIDQQFSSGELQKSKEELATSKNRMERLMESCLTAAKELKKMKTVCLDMLRAFRNEIDGILDAIESKTAKEIGQKYDELESKLNNDMHNISATMNKMHQRLEQLEVEDSNKSTLFVCQNMCRNITSSADDLCKYVGKPWQKSRLFFKGDTSIKSYMHRLSFLGSVRDHKTMVSSTMKEQTTHDIKVDDDQDQCNIWGTCVMGNGNILIADNANNKLKLLDKWTYNVVDYCGLTASPRSLCRVGGLEAAVSLSNKVIQFVRTGERLITTKSLQMEHNCFGLALTNGHMYISDGSQKVYVYNMNGDLQKTIFHDHAGGTIFSESRDITVSEDGMKIHVADSRKGLITLDIEGKVVWRYTGSELKGAYGVCTEGEGNLLVTGILSHNVMHMGQHGEKMEEIINASNGIQSPISVCFDKNCSKVLVTKIGNYLYAFGFD